MLGELLARVLDVSLIGCRVVHSARVPMKSMQTLRFRWRNDDVEMRGTVARCELQMVDGVMQYVTGLQFGTSVDDAPAIMRRIMNSLVDPKPAARTGVPFLNVDDNASVGEYLECTLADGRWAQRRVTEMRHPVLGFTIALPAPEREVESLCRAYAESDETMRTRIRAKLDLAAAQARRPK